MATGAVWSTTRSRPNVLICGASFVKIAGPLATDQPGQRLASSDVHVIADRGWDTAASDLP